MFARDGTGPGSFERGEDTDKGRVQVSGGTLSFRESPVSVSEVVKKKLRTVSQTGDPLWVGYSVPSLLTPPFPRLVHYSSREKS